MENFTWYFDAYITKWLMECETNCIFLRLLNLLKPVTRQTWKLGQYIIGIRTELSQRINAVHSSRGIYLCIYSIYLFNCKALFVSLKDKVCLKIAIPAYCFNIFCVLLCLLIKKLILGSKTNWQAWESFHVKL